MDKKYIISLGGSLIATPQGIDWKFLKKIRQLVSVRIKKGDKFFIICGGGMTARNYINAAGKVVAVTSDDSDWLGIHATRLNAHLIRTIFREIADLEIITNPTKEFKSKKKLVIAGGWRPGWSTDYVAVMLAEKYGVETVINLSNIDYVCDKDPSKFKDAKKLSSINWCDFRKIVGNKWMPGLNMPFDPVASKKAQKLGLKVAVINGKDIKSLSNYLAGKKFKGTVIKQF
jgi:uridylate kinase